MRLSVEEKLLLIVVAATLTGALLLLSAGQGSEPGQKPWRADSGLHFVTRLLNFDYAFPTPKGVTVKRLARGAGAAAALVLAAVMWVRRHSESIDPFPVRGQPIETAPVARPQRWTDAVTAADGAQLALLAFVAWSFISALWAPWSAVALGESALLAMGAVWAMCLGRCLSRRGAVAGTLILLALLVLTAVIGLWYYYERNPVQRLKFPIGNPLFMAACLLPGVVVAFCLGVGSARKAVLARCERCTVGAMAALLALAPLCWALRLTDSRGAMLGSGVGLWAAAYVCARGIWRWLLVGLGLVGIVLAAGFFQHRMTDLEGGRGASMRTRIYGWRYAGELFLARPVQGLGQGGYSLQAETLSFADAENDPLAFPGDRFTHAHNEWLETLADLGAVGITLLAMAFGLTFWGCRHVVQARAGTLEGWCYVGLIAAMAALAAEEATNVALRLPGLPVVWYTVLGLIWALMRREARPAQRAVPFAKPVLWSGAALAVALAAGLLMWSVRNWHGALAQARVAELLNRQQWLQAQTAAIVGRQGRLGADEVADSLAQKLFCHIRIVGFHLDSLMTSA
ncbi:MAG: O-antigen ligase family protein, partial [Phycisphaerae bacterium]|nr:O-antigen ligase family protein [Phycisphaerae bacterium]